MSMRRFIAHVGAHKTGTTAFQSSLQHNRKTLFDAGYLVPKSPIGNHAVLVAGLVDENCPQRAVNLFNADREAHSDHDILLSAELIQTLRRPALKRLVDKIDPMADKKIAIMVVRDPIAQLNSGYAQFRKSWRGRFQKFEDYLEVVLLPIARGRRNPIKHLKDAGFDLRVLPYDRVMESGGISRTIFNLPDFENLADRLDWSPIGSVNTSAGGIALLMLDMLRLLTRDAGFEKVTTPPPALRSRVIEIANKYFDDKPFNGFTPELRAHAIASTRDINAWIAENYFDGPWDEILPPAPGRPVSPQCLDDLPPRQANAVKHSTLKIMAEAQRKGWLR